MKLDSTLLEFIFSLPLLSSFVHITAGGWNDGVMSGHFGIIG